MKHIPYKYRLHTLLRKLSVEDYEIAMKELPRMCGIHSKTFRNWIYTRLDETREIPGTALLRLAQFFQIEPSEIYEQPPVPVE